MWLPLCALLVAPLPYQVTDQGVEVRYPKGTLLVTPRSERIFRIAFTPTNRFSHRPSLAVVSNSVLKPIVARKNGNLLAVSTPRARVQIDLATGRVALQDGAGKTLLQETAEKARSFEPTLVAKRAALHATQRFDMPKDQAFYGLGCLQDGLLDYTGHTLTLEQQNTIDVNPMLVSTGGYGILWDNASKTIVNVGDASTIIPADRLETPDHRPGLRARYYRGIDMKDVAAERTEKTVDADWTGSPLAGVPRTNFSATWDGYVKTAQAGKYTFTTEADDGARLTVNGKRIIDDWRTKPMSAATGSIDLPANSSVPIHLEYYQGGGEAGIHLAWMPPSQGTRLSFNADVADQIDYDFIVGPEIDDVIRGYRQLTGQAPMFGRWAYGLWQCKERYKTQQELLDIVGEYRRRQIPLDNIVQDWMYWPDKWGSHLFDPKRYPDPAGLLQTLHEQDHTHLMISVWAKFEKGSDNYDELDRQGYLYPLAGDWSGQDRYYDAFNPDARAVYWRQMRDKLFRYGIDGWWLDATEPEVPTKAMREFETALGPGGYVQNAYSLMTTQGVYQGQRKETNDKRVFILTRSVFSGQQRNAAATWSGDIQGTWDVFRKQVAGGLNFCMAGVPYWCTDIGGFFSPPNSDPDYKELFTRWFQWGTFCPIYRVHGTGTDKELWRFGSDTEKVLVRYDDLRYRLMPYIYSLAWDVTHNGGTMMRALPMNYRADRATWDVRDQLMFGPSLMVSPVLAAKATTRKVYLPAGPRWTDFWTGYSASGGKTIVSPAPIATMPIHVPAGSILPMGPYLQYTSEKPADPIELRIYPGADGRFELYEDEGDGYAYEKGVHATIPILWNDKQRTVQIGTRRGAYPGMPFSRRFQIVVVRPGHGNGLEPCGKPDRTVTYDGRALTLRM